LWFADDATQLLEQLERLMLRTSTLALAALEAFLLVILTASVAYAWKAATPKAKLEKDATHIVVGKVRSISFGKIVRPQFEITNYVAEIVVDRIEKGQGLKAGDVVHVRYHWTVSRIPYVGDPGHRPRPNKDDSARVYLVNQGYNGAGYTTDGGYDVYYFEGFEVLVPLAR
jgi:hypothetical protein